MSEQLALGFRRGNRVIADRMSEQLSPMAKPSRSQRESFDCPHCGEPVSVGALSCRACGSDAETGWSEEAADWTTDTSAGYTDEDEFDYDDFVRREFPDQAPARPTRQSVTRWAIAIE